MNEELYEALEVCLNTLETGADLESVLRRFPDLKDDLRPLLETSQQARLLAVPEVPAVVQRRTKARLLQYAGGMRASGAKPRKRSMLFAFSRLALSLTITFIFFLLSGTGLVRASNGALPGDDLYPVKRTWEDVRLILVLSPENRKELESEFGQERLQEIDELMVEKRHETITFAGLVAEQNGNVWIVSGIPVHITAASRLPQDPVSAGATIMVKGWTNTEGFVEAERVEILSSGLVLPALAPTEMESHQDTSNQEDSSGEQNDNVNQDDQESGSPSNMNQDDSGKEDVEENSNSNSESSHNDNGGEDQSTDDHSSQEQNDNKGSGGGNNENDNGDHN